MERGRREELLDPSLETERGEVKVYEAAVQGAQNDDLPKDSLVLLSLLPPPKERKEMKAAIGADRARQARDEMV